MKNQNFDPTIENRLAELQDVPARDPKNAAHGRASFLSEAAKYQQAVSPVLSLRQRGWMFPIRKEKFAMNALVSIIIAAAMVLGGIGTAAAAQNDLPTEPLYQVKLWTENASLAMAGDMETKANMLIEMTQTRVDEMIALAEMDVVPPAQVQQRLAQQLQQVLELSAEMEEPVMLHTLTQLRTRLQLQEQAMAQCNEDAAQLLTQTREMLRTRLHLVEEGLTDPQGFRYIIRNRLQYGQDEEAVPEPNQQGGPGFHQNDDAAPPTEQPGSGNGNGPAGGPNDEPGEPQDDGSGSGNPDSGNPDSGTDPGGNGSGGNGSGGNGSGGNGSGGNGSGGGK